MQLYFTFVAVTECLFCCITRFVNHICIPAVCMACNSDEMTSVGMACDAAAEQAEACMCLGAHHHQTDWSFVPFDS